MAKKKEENKKTKFIKILFTEEEFKDIGRYAQNSFQSKSEFVRVAIRERIDKLNKERFEISKLRSVAYEDFKYLFNEISKKAIEQELKEVLPLKKPNSEEMRERAEEKETRKRELSKIRESILKDKEY